MVNDYEWLIWWWMTMVNLMVNDYGEFDGDYEWLIWWWMTMVNLMVNDYG